MIIAFTGYKRAGKDTASNLAQEFLKKNSDTKFWPILALADPIKKAAAAIFGWGEQELFGSLKEISDPRYGISPRYFMQLLGTEIMREGLGLLAPEYKRTVGETLWCRRLIAEMENRGVPNCIISDMRFPNEARFFRENHDEKVLVVRIKRPGFDVSDHPSEREVDNIEADAVIHNNGSISDLREAISTVCQGLI